MSGSTLCFVGPLAGESAGHVPTQGEYLARHLSAHGYTVQLVSSHPNRYVRLLDVVVTLIRQRRKIRVQCIQVYSGRSFLIVDAASALGRLFGHTVVMQLHGGSLPDFMKQYPNWTRRVLSRADTLVTPSSFLARTVTQFGLQAQVIPNVVDLADYPYRRREQLAPRLFWMRALQALYNPQMAVRVLARVRAHYADARLVMAGPDIGLRAEVETLARELGVSDALDFVGLIDMAGKSKYGNWADVFINTNHVDNMPVSIVEACAMGLPVNVGGRPDLLTDGDTGLLVPDDDDEAMADAVLRLLRDPALSQRLSSNGRKLAESLSWERVYPRWSAVFAAAGLDDPAGGS
jgi:glycosyltransferase involved in cell wall biosynthesis